MERLICIAPVFDEVTEITFEESRDVVEYAEEHGVEVIDVTKENATREKVEEVLRKYPRVLVHHADHGNETSWIGAEGKPIIDLKNVDLLADRECYCNNCSSAKSLGVEAWKLKATYWGYKEVFVFTVEEKDYFKQFVNNGIKRKIDGYTWKECLQMTKDLANTLIDQLVSAGKALAAACLRHDADVLVCYNAESPPEEPCTISRLIVSLFGYKVLWKLRKIRGRLTCFGLFLFYYGWA